jgi:hypothetical protein
MTTCTCSWMGTVVGRIFKANAAPEGYAMAADARLRAPRGPNTNAWV